MIAIIFHSSLVVTIVICCFSFIVNIFDIIAQHPQSIFIREGLKWPIQDIGSFLESSFSLFLPWFGPIFNVFGFTKTIQQLNTVNGEKYILKSWLILIRQQQ